MAASLSSISIQEDHHCNVWYRRIYWNGRGGPHPAGGAGAAWSTGGMTPPGVAVLDPEAGAPGGQGQGAAPGAWPTSSRSGAEADRTHGAWGIPAGLPTGRPTTSTPIPRSAQSGRIAVVHNGIIENYARAEGVSYGVQGDSTSSRRRIRRWWPSCWSYYYEGDNMLEAVGQVPAPDRGVLCPGHHLRGRAQTRLIAVRKDSPLIIGLRGRTATFMASDVTAVIKYTRDVCYHGGWGGGGAHRRQRGTVFDNAPAPAGGEGDLPSWTGMMSAAEKGGYEHFMFKEIMEQPKALRGHHLPPPAGRRKWCWTRSHLTAGGAARGWTGCTSSPAAPPTMWAW